MNWTQSIEALNKLPEETIETVEQAWARNGSKINEEFFLVLPTCKSGDDWAYLHCKRGTTIARIAAKITGFYSLLNALQDDDMLDHNAIASFRDYSELIEMRSPYTGADLPAIGINLEG